MFRYVLILLYCGRCLTYGFDSGGEQGACGRHYRSGRMHKPPCDLGNDGYCTSAGSAYPWHAVKRFVRENQGMMRRMYGDQRHGQVLRAELEDVTPLQPLDNKMDDYESRKTYAKQEFDFNIDNELYHNRDENEPRYLRDEDIRNEDVLNTKFVYSEEPAISIKLAELKIAPHFRPTTQKSTTTAEVPKTTNNEEFDGTETEVNTVELTTDTTSSQKSANVVTGATLQNDDQETQSSAVLFQDMDDETKNKVQVNYQMRGVNACPVKEEVVAPFWANNTRGEVLALLNMYPFEQYVHWEKCTHEHRQMYCRDGCRCEQQYRLHRLLAYDPNNECRGIFSDWFRFPSCCVCKCYSIPEFRATSRSPRDNGEKHFQGLPDWYVRKNKGLFPSSGHG